MTRVGVGGKYQLKPSVSDSSTSTGKNSEKVGSGLLAQLQLLKANKSVTSTKTSTARISIANEVDRTEGDMEQKPVKLAYAVKETELPVNSQGEVRKASTASNPSSTTTGACDGNADSATHGGAEKSNRSTPGAGKSKAVQVFRSAVVQAARMELPVCAMEQEIVEAVNCAENDAIILCGETGSGKSTQVPQFLYEAGYAEGGLIGITQPRRVAVTSTAERVSFEMTSGLPENTPTTAPKKGNNKKNSTSSNSSNSSSSNNDNTGPAEKRRGQLVGYQIRFDSSTVGPDTRIKFMTDGILLKEVASDLLLRKYRVVILDEAHERNMNTDVLLGMLSKVLPLRRAQAEIEQKKYLSLPESERSKYALPLQPLKLIIMSATMRVNDFQNPILFPVAVPPIIKVDARQYPVTTHFSKRTEVKNYLKETHKKVCQIHRKLPEGGVLIFLSGKQEILYMCHKLNRSLNKRVKGQHQAQEQQPAGEEEPALAESEGKAEVVGLGASAEEMMELQEDADLRHLTASTSSDCNNFDANEGFLSADSKDNKTNKHGKKGKKDPQNKPGSASSSDRHHNSIRELLGQDEIFSDSEDEREGRRGEGDGDSSDDEGDADNDDEDSVPDIDKKKKVSSSSVAAGATTEESPVVVSPEEAIFILDGDDDSHRRSSSSSTSSSGGMTMKARFDSSKASLTTGDAMRDQMLKEALGIDPQAISGSALMSGADTAVGEEESDNKTLGGFEGDEEKGGKLKEGEREEGPQLRAWILPLYALMPAAQQKRVFLPPPPGHRLIVVATNVAETSITIPGIRYVVDSGRQKEKVITSAVAPKDEEASPEDQPVGGKRAFEGTKVIANDAVSTASAAVGAGIAKYEVKWVSQAAAMQRQGRAGRTGPGHCYRLYSANFFHQYLQPYQPPEITVTPLEELILQMKALGIDHIERFPFPTPPPQTSIRSAISLLTNLGAISTPGAALTVQGNGENKKMQDLTAAIAMATMHAMKSKTALAQRQLQQLQELHKQQQLSRESCPLTPLGRTLARFPINPRFAKMLVMAFRASGIHPSAVTAATRDKLILLSHALTLVATLAERSVFEGMGDNVPGTGGGSKKNKTEVTSSKALEDDSSSSEEDDEDQIAAQSEELRKQGSLFHHEDGDALARLRATGAYIHTVAQYVTTNLKKKRTGGRVGKADVLAANEGPGVRALCSAHHLHAPTLQRIVELRDQLQDISTSVLLSTAPASSRAGDTKKDSDSTESMNDLLAVPLQPPSSAQELALRQLVVSGFCDSIARRVPLGVIKTGPRRRRLTAYYSSHPALQDVPLYLHPGSNLYRKDPTASLPEFVTYGSLVRNQRGDCIYMTCVSTVSPSWLSSVAADCPLLRWSAPVSTPTPYYDAAADAIMCYVTPRFGVHSWELPVMRRPLYDCTVTATLEAEGSSGGGKGSSVGTAIGFRKQDEAYRWFGKLLLEGGLFSASSSVITSNCARELRSALNKTKLKDASASVITQMKPIPKVSNLLRKLVTREICTVSSLYEQVRREPLFLADEVTEFLVPEARAAFRSAWQRFATSPPPST